nr:putative alpha/beta hydrolase [uncultured bacterium]
MDPPGTVTQKKGELSSGNESSPFPRQAFSRQAETGQAAPDALTCTSHLVEINGPQAPHWQAPAIREVAEWILPGR